jgi:hypothetical protein
MPSKRVEPKQFILLMINTTLCKDFRNDFVVYDKIACRECIWEDNDLIKRFWCLPDHPVDLDKLKLERSKCISRHRWEYNPLRGYPRDCKNPETDVAGNASIALIADVEAKWKITRGRAPDMATQRHSRTIKEKDSSLRWNMITLGSNRKPKLTDIRHSVRITNISPGPTKNKKRSKFMINSTYV